tara:strand:+ start:611 stop:871 length:261 start_codon:yes stop_codon:yes gene_type:complete
MKITKRQLKRIIKEEKAKLAEQSHRGNPNKPWDMNFPPGSISKAAANPAHMLGAKIEEAIALAQQAHPNSAVLDLLEEAHELLMGY